MIVLSLHPNRIHANQPTQVILRLTNTDAGTCTNVRLTFRFPREVLIIRGKSRLPRISSLEKGACYDHKLHLKVAHQGTFHFLSTNFSYLNPMGQSVRPAQIKIPIQVAPAKKSSTTKKISSERVPRSGIGLEEAKKERHYLITLRQILRKHFSLGELRTLCFDAGIDYDDLPGVGKADKARELVAHFERRNSTTELIDIVVRLRPNIDLENILKR